MIESLLGRMTAWLLRHRLLVVLFWLLPTPLLVMGYLGVNRRLKSTVDTSAEAQSTTVAKKRAAGFSRQTEFIATVTFHHDKLTVDDKPVYESVARLNAAFKKHPCTARLISYAELPLRELFVSKDGLTQATVLEMNVSRGDYSKSEGCVRRYRKLIAKMKPGLPLPRLEVLVTGIPAFEVDIGVIVQRDSTRAEAVVFVISLILLVWMFRSAAAALLPLITAAMAVTGCLSIIYVVAGFMKLSFFASTMATMSGLGLGLDYALLYVNRVKEELSRGQEPQEAIVTAGRTAGKAILVSGTLVMLGLAGLFIPQLGLARSLAFSGIIIVSLTLLTTLTLLPVLLSFWQPVLSWPRWRWFTASHAAVDRFWERWASFVIRRPWAPILLAMAIMICFAPRIFDIRVMNPRHEIVPSHVEARRGLERVIEIAGEGQIYPVTCLVEITDGGTWDDPRRQKLLIEQLEKIRAMSSVAVLRGPDLLMSLSVNLLGVRLGAGFGDGFAGRFISDNRRMVTFDVHVKKVTDQNLDALVLRQRRELPRYFAKDPGIKVWVGGQPATTWETKKMLVGSLPTMVPTILIAAFLVMALFFRSLVIPFKAVLLNALSLCTTYGILVLVFQQGYGLSLLGVQGGPQGALSLITPVVLFCVLFGVSMDYEVFLVSRIKETFVAAGGPKAPPERQQEIHLEAIHRGLSRTGGIITNAALIMVITFAAFVSGVLLPMKEMGFALALAVALDATLVRMMLVPAILRLVGRRTWWFPGA